MLTEEFNWVVAQIDLTGKVFKFEGKTGDLRYYFYPNTNILFIPNKEENDSLFFGEVQSSEDIKQQINKYA